MSGLHHGMNLRDALIVAGRLGCAESRHKGHVVLSHPLGKPTKILQDNRRKDATRTVTSWLMALEKADLLLRAGNAILAGREPVIRRLPLDPAAERRAARKERERQEAERKAREAAERAARIEPQPAAPNPEPTKEPDMGAPRYPRTIREKVRLKDLLLKEANRLHLTPYDLAQLIGVSAGTAEEWARPDAVPGPSIPRFREWIDVLKAMKEDGPRTPVQAPPPAPAAEAPPPTATAAAAPPPPPPEHVEVTPMPGGALVTLGAVTVDLGKIGDEDLLGLQSVVTREVLRRSRR